MTKKTVTLIRKEQFCAAHRLHAKELSDAQNKKIFGKCNNANGHGHNYEIEVMVEGEVDPVTGMVINLFDLKTIIEDKVIDRFDHKNLNLDTKEFKTLNPTAENLAITCWNLIEEELPKGILRQVKISETDNNIAIYKGE